MPQKDPKRRLGHHGKEISPHMLICKEVIDSVGNILWGNIPFSFSRGEMGVKKKNNPMGLRKSCMIQTPIKVQVPLRRTTIRPWPWAWPYVHHFNGGCLAEGLALAMNPTIDHGNPGFNSYSLSFTGTSTLQVGLEKPYEQQVQLPCF